MKRKNYFMMGAGWILFGALMLSLMGFAVMTLWNWLIPDLFSGNTITFLQSIGIIALAKLLTGFHGWGSGHRWKGKYTSNKHGYWKERWDAKMANMTPEEKEKFKQMYYDRCGWKGWKENKTTNEKNEVSSS